MLDSDLAEIYGVTTTRLNEQVRRNKSRFPLEFAFVLSDQEFKDLMAQNGLPGGRGGRRKNPWVFTEHGALMAANILNSSTAVEMSIVVIKAFVRLRQIMIGHKELASRLADLERKVGQHDEEISAAFQAIRKLMTPAPAKKIHRIGF